MILRFSIAMRNLLKANVNTSQEHNERNRRRTIVTITGATA
jgi:hypothetical protein